MIKKTTLLLYCLFSTAFLFAQKPTSTINISITGKVVDSKTNQPLEYATVVLKNTKTAKISGGITDEKGNFNIKTPKGNYEISVEYISFKTKKFPIQEITSNIIERYNDEVMSGVSKEEAYIKCIDSLGNIRSGANIDDTSVKAKSYPISLYISIILTLASFVLFFVNTFWSNVLLSLTIVIFYLELRNQFNLVKKNISSSSKVFLLAHKYIIIAWSLIFSLIIIETINNVFFDIELYIKFDLSIYFNSEPVGVLILINLLFMALIFIPLSLYHNNLVSSYLKYESLDDNLRHSIWKKSDKKQTSYSLFKNHHLISKE